ncbi:zinc finger domain-containing protein [Mycobacteroides abscessus]
MTRDEVIDVLTAVVAADRRTVGKADVDVWQAVIGDLPVEMAVEAVRDHLRERPDVWLQPGHIYERVKAKRRDQLARESADERRAREDQRDIALEARNRERLGELVEAMGKPLRQFIRPSTGSGPAHPETTVDCPWVSCRAKPGRPCVNHDGTPLKGGAFHPSRTEAVMSAEPPPLAG